jgi:hypothetical protein
MQQPIHPAQFVVDYPDRPLNRLTTFFRLFMVIPIAFVLGSVDGQIWQYTSAKHTVVIVASAGGLLFLGPLLMILFRQKYPRWWFDWNGEPGGGAGVVLHWVLSWLPGELHDPVRFPRSPTIH